jgi:Uri superfamily endonuclease
MTEPLEPLGTGDFEDSNLAPAEPGSYVVIAYLAAPTRITVGKLGRFDFEAGYYAYAGSALGSGGLAARLAHHHQQHKKLQWHIDYLLEYAGIIEIWWAVDPKRKECNWASALRSVPGAKVPVPNFGASDCRCLSHLVYFPEQPQFASFARALSDLEF